MIDAVTDGDLDVGITIRQEAEELPEISVYPLYSLRTEMVMHKSNPLSSRENLRLTDFTNQTFVTIPLSESRFVSDMTIKSCLDAGFRAEVKKAPDMKSQILELEAGEGVAPFNEYHVTCNHPDLVHVPLRELPQTEFCAVWRDNEANPAKDLFVKILRQLP